MEQVHSWLNLVTSSDKNIIITVQTSIIVLLVILLVTSLCHLYQQRERQQIPCGSNSKDIELANWKGSVPDIHIVS